VTVYVVIAGYNYDSNWVLGITTGLDAAKALAKKLTGATEWTEVSQLRSFPDRVGMGDIICDVGRLPHDDMDMVMADDVTIQRWEVQS